MKRVLVTPGAAWLALTAALCTGAILEALIVSESGGLGVGTAWSAAIDWQPGRALSQPWRLWTCAWVHWSVAHLGVNLLGAAVVGALGWRARVPRAGALAWFVAWPLTHLLMAPPGSGRLAQTLLHYGGLSGVLHAGVVVLALSLAWPRGLARAAAGRGGVRAEPSFDATRASSIEPSRITEGPWAMTTLEELSSATAAMPLSTLDGPSSASMPLSGLTREQALRHRWVGVAILAGTVAKVLLESPWNPALRPNALLGIAVAPLAHACGIAAGAAAWAVVGLGQRLLRGQERAPD